MTSSRREYLEQMVETAESDAVRLKAVELIERMDEREAHAPEVVARQTAYERVTSRTFAAAAGEAGAAAGEAGAVPGRRRARPS